MGQLTRISSSFIVDGTIQDIDISGSAHISASKIKYFGQDILSISSSIAKITSSAGLHITGSTTISGGNLTLVGSTFSASQAQHPDSATGSVLYVKLNQTGSFASGSDFQTSTTLGNSIGSIHRRTGSVEVSASTFEVTASGGFHLSASAFITGALNVQNDISGSNLTVAQGNFRDNVAVGTAAIPKNLDVHGTLIVSGNISTSGSITAKEFHSEFVSSSILYSSGSNKFGDSQDDKHEFTGSLDISGSASSSLKTNIGASGSMQVTASGYSDSAGGVHISGSLFVTGSQTQISSSLQLSSSDGHNVYGNLSVAGTLSGSTSLHPDGASRGLAIAMSVAL